MMKALLIHTDGYTIDVVGQYDSVEEASKIFIWNTRKCVLKRFIQNGSNNHIVITKMRFYISMEKMCMSGRL